MSEAVMAVVKPEIKSYIWLQTADGSIQQVEEEVAVFCPMICREIIQTGMGSSKNYAISLPQRVNLAILGLVLDYCRFHQVPGRSNKIKSYIWLQTADGSIQQVEEEVAVFCPMICREIIQTGMGSSKNYAISLPQRVNLAILGLVLDYCRFHQVPGRSNKIKSYIWLQTADGSIQQVEEEVAVFCPMICREIIQTGMGSSKNYAISLPQRVNLAILGLVLDYCRFHQVPGRSNKECKIFDEKFIRMDTKRLCELTSAADSLQLKPLVDITSRALARIIEGKTPEEIRETFHLPDDLTEEEKLEPLRNITDDPRIRLLNRLYARKRKELKERQKLNNVEIVEEQLDDRSVDDLLSFINGGDGGIGDKGSILNSYTKGARTNRSKKKNRRRKDQSKDYSIDNVNGNNNKELHDLTSACQAGEVSNGLLASPSTCSKLQDSAVMSFSPKVEFDDGDIDDDIDPAMKEELDREVEDFARRLNSDWPERMQEILSFGQERRLMPISMCKYEPEMMNEW